MIFRRKGIFRESSNEFNAGMDRISMAIAGGRGAKHIGELLEESLRDAERRQVLAKEGKTPGVPTGLSRLDELTTRMAQRRIDRTGCPARHG